MTGYRSPVHLAYQTTGFVFRCATIILSIRNSSVLKATLVAFFCTLLSYECDTIQQLLVEGIPYLFNLFD